MYTSGGKNSQRKNNKSWTEVVSKVERQKQKKTEKKDQSKKKQEDQVNILRTIVPAGVNQINTQGEWE